MQKKIQNTLLCGPHLAVVLWMVNEIPKQSLPIAIPPLAELLQLTAKSSDYIWVEFFQARATFTRYTFWA